MPTIRVSTDVQAAPDVVFAAVSDLSGHGRWSADPLEVVPLDDTPIRVGKRYRSTATSKGKTFTADLVVTEHEPPRRFGFTATDASGSYRHVFTMSAGAGGVTRVERVVTGRLTLAQRILFAAVYLPVKRPNAQRALARLTARLEGSER